MRRRCPSASCRPAGAARAGGRVADCYAALVRARASAADPSESLKTRGRRARYRSLHTAVVVRAARPMEVQTAPGMHARPIWGGGHWLPKGRRGPVGGEDKRILGGWQLLEQARSGARKGGISRSTRGRRNGRGSRDARPKERASTQQGRRPRFRIPGDTCSGTAAAVQGRGRIGQLIINCAAAGASRSSRQNAETRRDWLQASSGFLARNRSRERCAMVQSWIAPATSGPGVRCATATARWRRPGDLQPCWQFNAAPSRPAGVSHRRRRSNQVGRALLTSKSRRRTRSARHPHAAQDGNRGGAVTVQGVSKTCGAGSRGAAAVPGEAIVDTSTARARLSVHRRMRPFLR